MAFRRAIILVIIDKSFICLGLYNMLRMKPYGATSAATNTGIDRVSAVAGIKSIFKEYAWNNIIGSLTFLS